MGGVSSGPPSIPLRAQACPRRRIAPNKTAPNWPLDSAVDQLWLAMVAGNPHEEGEEQYEEVEGEFEDDEEEYVEGEEYEDDEEEEEEEDGEVEDGAWQEATQASWLSRRSKQQ